MIAPIQKKQNNRAFFWIYRMAASDGQKKRKEETKSKEIP
jgi:hypothetical protein